MLLAGSQIWVEVKARFPLTSGLARPSFSSEEKCFHSVKGKQFHINSIGVIKHVERVHFLRKTTAVTQQLLRDTKFSKLILIPAQPLAV